MGKVIQIVCILFLSMVIMVTKFAIISDIHSNLYALEATLKDIKKRHVDKIYALGDLVGYFNKPNEVIDLIKKENIIAIAGNHDEKYFHKSKDYQKLSGSYGYTNRILTDENRMYLKSLPNHIDLKEYAMIMVHGSLSSTSEYVYKEDIGKFQNNNYDYIIMGHTHLPMIEPLNGKVFVNPGSVGKPKHGNSNASYVIFDSKTKSFEHIQVSYDPSMIIHDILHEDLIQNSLIEIFKNS